MNLKEVSRDALRRASEGAIGPPTTTSGLVDRLESMRAQNPKIGVMEAWEKLLPKEDWSLCATALEAAGFDVGELIDHLTGRDRINPNDPWWNP